MKIVADLQPAVFVPRPYPGQAPGFVVTGFQPSMRCTIFIPCRLDSKLEQRMKNGTLGARGNRSFCPVFRSRRSLRRKSRVLGAVSQVVDNQSSLFSGNIGKIGPRCQSCPLAVPNEPFEVLKVVFWPARTTFSAAPNESFDRAGGPRAPVRHNFPAPSYPPGYTHKRAGCPTLVCQKILPHTPPHFPTLPSRPHATGKSAFRRALTYFISQSMRCSEKNE